MSDINYEVFQHYGTNAARLTFTPAPAAGIAPTYFWYETDTNNFYIYTTGWKGPYRQFDIIPVSGQLSNAQLLAMRTTPVTAIAAPGAGFMVKPRYIHCRLKIATAYGNIIPSGGTFATFGWKVGTAQALSIVDNTTFGANITAGAPLPGNVLPGYNPAAFTGTFGTIGSWEFNLEAPALYKDYSNTYGLLNYGFDMSAANNQPFQFIMTADGAGTNLTLGAAGNVLDWYIEYQILALP